ncbi:MAG: ARPP-1 family domain-containing protein [Actinomycetota bacterium]
MITLSPAAPQRHESLTVYPLLSPDGVALGCVLLPDAIRAGTLRITEVGRGTVPELIAINTGDTDVLVLDGEQLIGARQNRMASRSILLPEHSETKIPVSCMEHGRWRFRSDEFTPSEYYSPSNVRRRHRTAETSSVEAGVAAAPHVLRHAQGAVWNDIAFLADDLDAHSPSGALNESMERREEDLKAWAARVPAVHGQVGMAAFVGGRPLALDVVGDRALYASVHERLIGGYVLDALRARGETATPEPDAAERFLTSVREATRTEAPTVGRGAYRVLSGAVVGGELEDDGRTVHVSAFPPDEETVARPFGEARIGSEPPLPPPSRRRG